MQHKQFPPNSSLEHLKSQAKQLLKAHEEGSLDALQRIRSFFPNVARRLQAHIEKSDATDTEIQDAAFGLQDAQLVIAREYGFASWTRLKEEVLYQEQGAESTPAKDLLFQILCTVDLTQADIQRVDELLTADPSLVSARDEDGRTPIQVLASRKIIDFGKEQWSNPIRQLYQLLKVHRAETDTVAAILMDDREQVQADIRNNPQVLKQRFDIPGNWRGINLLAVAAGCARTEIARVLIEADPSLVTGGQSEGKAPMDLLVKPWHHSAFEVEPRKPIYDLLIENGAMPDLAAAIIMDDEARVVEYIWSDPKMFEKQFVCGNQILLRPIEIAAAYGHDFILEVLCNLAAVDEVDITQDLASALTQTFDMDVTEQLLEKSKPPASVLTDALAFACEVYQPEKVRLLLKYGADPSASVKAKFRYDVVQNLKPSDNASRTYEMSPLLVAIGTWYGMRESVPALDECLEIVEALLEAGADLHRRYKVDIDGEILELTPLTYTQKLASLFPDKPFERVIEVLRASENRYS